MSKTTNMITDKDTIELDGYTIHLPPKAEGQTHWEIPSICVDDLPLEPKEWRIVIAEKSVEIETDLS